MYKDEAVKLMSDYIDAMNRQLAAQANMPSDQLEQAIVQGRPQLDHVNGMLYDLLKENGVLAAP
jgi:transcriptional/translational regulatory protein YebC/TACO1